MVALNIPESDIGRRVQEWVALELFQEGGISAGKAAQLLGISKLEFLDLRSAKPAYLDADPNELKREVEAAEAASRLAVAGAFYVDVIERHRIILP